MKKILILGGAAGQVPLIQAAKNEGYYVVLCDWTTTNPGIPLADKHYQVSTLDYDAVLQVAQEEKIDGVISNSEPAMMNVAKIATQLSLIGNSPKSIELLQSKHGFREFQHEMGLFCPKSFEASTIDDLLTSLKSSDFPIVVKPSKSSGSRGTTIIQKYDEYSIEKAFFKCKEYSTNSAVTVEGYVPMPNTLNIGGDVFVHNGKIIFDGISSCIRCAQCKEVPIGEMWPIAEDSDTIETLQNQIYEIFNKARIKHGEYNIEAYKTNDNDLFFIEINVRQGGNSIPQLIHDYCGIDMHKLLVTTCMGDDLYFNSIVSSKHNKNYITNYVVFADRKGLFNRIIIGDMISKYVYNITECVKQGDEVQPVSNAADALGMIRMRFPNRGTQMQYVSILNECIWPDYD